MAEITFKSRYVIEPPESKDLTGLGDVVRGRRSCCGVMEWAEHLPACSKSASTVLEKACAAAMDRATQCPAGVSLSPTETDNLNAAFAAVKAAYSEPNAAPIGRRFEKTCPLCGFVSDRIGSAPTFCVACDSPFEMKKDKPVHCAICNQQAPYVVGMLPNYLQKGLVPNTAGWGRSFFPWPERMSEGLAVHESQWTCPPCAVEVAKFIAHRRQPMRTEYENLSE